MVSVLQINSQNINNTKSNNRKLFKSSALNTISASKNDTASLLNYMSLLAKNNANMVSFGSGQEIMKPRHGYHGFEVKVPRDGTYMDGTVRYNIETEATKHINGDVIKWNLNELRPWMVSAETDSFMSVGGLAKVADDLPGIFNKKFKGSDNLMTIVTPIYLNGKNNTFTLENHGQSAKYTYKNNEIKLSKMTDISVPMFDEWKNGGEIINKTVSVFVGRKETIDENGEKKQLETPYIMFYEPDIFDISKSKAAGRPARKNKNCEGCYVTNPKGYDENIRFAFFSKCVYELAKKLKQQGNEYTPNIMLMNDWHVGSLAPLLKYLAPSEADNKHLDAETANYLYNLPTLYIAHNLGYQGAINQRDEDGDCEAIRTKVLGTLFAQYTKTILEHSLNHSYLPAEDQNTMFKYNALNPGMMGVSLADRIVPVSVNYGEELLASSKFANGLQNLLNIRNTKTTFTPITNGYSKELVVPNKKNIKKWQDDISSDLLKGITKATMTIPTDDIKFVPYMVNDNTKTSDILAQQAGIETDVTKAKNHNKNEMFKLLNRIIKRERLSDNAHWNSLDTLETDRRYVLYQPNQTDLSDIEDPSKVPVMTFVGRVADQKGMDTIYKKAILNFAREFTEDAKLPEERRKYKGWDVPVTLIGGTVAEMSSYTELESLKRELREINPKFADRMLLFKGFANTNFLALGTDFFLIPSNFEPCGLIQMEVMAKGVIPIATATGGLVSTIDDTYNGFLSSVFYDEKDSNNPYVKNNGKMVYVGTNMKNIPETNWRGFEDAMKKALHTYFNMPNRFVKMQKTAMLKDFSWDVRGGALDKYVQLMKNGEYKNTDRTCYFNLPDAKDTEPYIIEK